MKAYKRFLKIFKWSDQNIPTFRVRIPDPRGPCDFSYIHFAYWFHQMIKYDGHKQKFIIMARCPKTNLLMSMSNVRAPWDNEELQVFDDYNMTNIIASGWYFESEEVQRAYSNWLAEKEIFGL